MAPFTDRRHAGRVLTAQLKAYVGRRDVVVLALPRGGVPVATEVAEGLGAPLDVFVVRKIGMPGHEELALGAVASGGVHVFAHEVMAAHRLGPDDVEPLLARERARVAQQEERYRGEHPRVPLRGKTVILVDDGLATGSTMRAAIAALRDAQPERVVVAVPVAPPETCAALAAEVDEVICPLQPPDLAAVALWYDNFSQTEDAEVRALLARARGSAGSMNDGVVRRGYAR